MEKFENQEGKTLHSLGGRTIIQYENNLVVKSGDIRAHEVQTLEFIAAKTTIPIPKVHHVHYEDGKVMAIVKDYIPGKSLDEAWDSLDPHQKLSIANDLQFYMSQLRKLKGDCMGAIDPWSGYNWPNFFN